MGLAWPWWAASATVGLLRWLGGVHHTLREGEEGGQDGRVGGAQELRVLAFLRKDFPSQSAIATHRASLSLRFARALVEPVLLPLELGLVVHLVVDAAVWTWSATRNDYL